MNRIALGCADPGHLFHGHFGESPGFVIVDLDDHTPTEWRENPWREEPIATRPPKIAALLDDCATIMVRAIAKEGLAQLSQRFTVTLAPSEDVTAIVDQLARTGLAGVRSYDRERGKFVGG